MDDRPPRVFNHLDPVLLLQLLAVVAQVNLANGVGASNPGENLQIMSLSQLSARLVPCRIC